MNHNWTITDAGGTVANESAGCEFWLEDGQHIFQLCSYLNAHPDYIGDVARWHVAFGVKTKSASQWDNEMEALRLRLLHEELKELKDWMEQGNQTQTLDALLDLQWVLAGTVHALGYADAFADGWAEVRRSNWSKLGADGKPILREDGKILKGPNYTPPDLAAIVGRLL